jgi:hypothetical protein
MLDLYWDYSQEIRDFKEKQKIRYNGFEVELIGDVQKIAGGYSRRVRIINPPKYVFDREFNAACKENGDLL